MTERKIENQDIKETIVFDAENIQSKRLRIEVDAYPVQERDFEILINFGSGLKEWSRIFFLSGLGAIVISLAKAVDFLSSFRAAKDKNRLELKIEDYEFYALVISLGISLLLFLGSLCWKNKKDKLIGKIKNHFKSVKNV